MGLIMECLHSGATWLHDHLQYVITNGQNINKIIICQLIKMIMVILRYGTCQGHREP
jgi:hypothetical protein